MDHAHGMESREPTLLIKANTLLLRYIVRGVPLRLAFALMDDRLLYALEVKDEPLATAMLWSIVERKEELEALHAAIGTGTLQAFLFNELAVNVAWTEVRWTPPSTLETILPATALGKIDHTALNGQVSAVLDALRTDSQKSNTAIATLEPAAWNPINSYYVTNSAQKSLLNLFDVDEGAHQEQLALWLTDSLRPAGAHHSPQVSKGKGQRELTDVLLSHEYGSVLIESKTLSIPAADTLPSRTQLAKRVSGHISKAASQLRGGIRLLKNGTVVTDSVGNVLDVERTYPMHAIILVPDLELVEEPAAYGPPFIGDFMRATGGFLHILDVAELLRVVQAAEILAARSDQTSPIMAFDYYLLERVKIAQQNGTLVVKVLLRFKESEP